MKKLFLIVFMVLCMAMPTMATNYDYKATVYKKVATMGTEAKLTPITSGVIFTVLTAGSDTAATCYVHADDTYTSLTNPVTTTNFASTTYCGGKVKFRTTSSTQDLIVTDTATGSSVFIDAFSPNDHTIVIDATPGKAQVAIIPFSASDNTETDTEVDIPYDSIITDCRVEVVTVDATETIDVGLLSTETSGDADGLRDGVSVATASFVADTGVVTNGNTIDYTPDSTYGALLYTIIAGSDAVATGGGRTYMAHVVKGADAKSITYTGSAGSDTAAGYIYVMHRRLR